MENFIVNGQTKRRILSMYLGVGVGWTFKKIWIEIKKIQADDTMIF